MAAGAWWRSRMEPLALAEKRIPKKDLATGIGASLAIHVLIFSSAFFWALLMPHKTLNPPYCSVDLVSVKDIGIGSSNPKGNPEAAEKAVVSKHVQHRARVRRKLEAAVPIKRLAVNETTRKLETHIREIEPKDIPVMPEKPQGLEAIDKNLDKLIARPKVIPRSSPPSAQRVEHESRSPARLVRSPSSDAKQPGNEVTRGTPTGAARGGRQGTSQGSAFGTPYGSAAINQIASIYGERVRQKIQSEWRLVNDQGIDGLKAVVAVRIRRTGEIVSVVLMKKSGNELFDEAAVRAVNKAAPLPPVPAAIAQSSTELILTFMPGRVS